MGQMMKDSRNKQRKPTRHTPARARKVERRYGQQLRKIASYVDTIVRGFDVTDETIYPSMVSALRRYADTLTEWAQQQAGRMVLDVALRDEQTWMTYSEDMSKALKDEIRNAPTGVVMQRLMTEQAQLIKNIPSSAAQRISDLVTQAQIDGMRASELVDAIMATGQVSKNRANTIARTEVARAASTLTQARAEHIGSEGYIWRTSGDSDVRSDHEGLDGKFFRWDGPPIADKRSGARAHAGCIYNCRCYPEPVIPD